MARRGFGGMTALRAALGAATGVAEGLQERELLAAKRKQEEEANALARFSALRAAGFGFAPVRTAADPAAREAFALETPDLPAPTMGGSQLGTALAKATQGGLGVSGRPTGMLDTPISLALDTSKTRQFERGAGMQAATPAERIKIGGMELGLVSPEAMESRKSQQAIDTYRRQRQVDVESDIAKKDAERKAKEQDFVKDVEKLTKSGVPEAKAIQTIVLGGKYNDLFMSPEAQAMQSWRNASLALEREKFEFDKTKRADEGQTGSVDYTAELQIIQDFLPTVGPDGKVAPPKRTLSGPKSLAVQQGGQGGTFVGQAANLGLSGLGADMTNEQLYNSIAEGIATSYAMQEQKGKNVSDKDIANRISQIKVLPNEVGSLEVQRLKGQRLLQWANSLKQGNVPQVAPGQTATPPVIPPAGGSTGGGFPSFEEWKKSRGGR